MSSLVKPTAFAHICFIYFYLYNILFSFGVLFPVSPYNWFLVQPTSLPPVLLSCFGDFGIITRTSGGSVSALPSVRISTSTLKHLFRCGFRLRGLLMLLGNSGSCLSWFGISYSGAVNWFSILKHLPRNAIIVEVVDCIRAYQGFLSIVSLPLGVAPPPPIVTTTASTIIAPVSCHDSISKK